VICIVAGYGPRGVAVPGGVLFGGESTGRAKEAADDGEEVLELHGDGWQQSLEKESRPRVLFQNSNRRGTSDTKDEREKQKKTRRRDVSG